MAHSDSSLSYHSHISWTAPSNIALIKYWGKRSNQVPMNPSISMTLSKSVTRTTVHYSPSESGNFSREFFFEGNRTPEFESKLDVFFAGIRELLPGIATLKMRIESENSFPHSSGIASSASSMAALALCLVSIENELKGEKMSPETFKQRASQIARLGSGSAARSIYPGYVWWGESSELANSSDNFAVEISEVHPFFQNLEDTILIVSSDQKKVSSSAGHNLMKTHPFAQARYLQAQHNGKVMLDILKKGSADEFIAVVENEALTLHALMMSSNPGYILMKPATLEIIRKVQDYREQTGRFIAFTLDAGPNIHLLYHDKNKHETERFIERELMKFCENEVFITDRLGAGPYKNEIKNL